MGSRNREDRLLVLPVMGKVTIPHLKMAGFHQQSEEKTMKTSVQFCGKAIYITATGLKVGARGKVLPVGAMLGNLSKGEARRIRKSLFRQGRRKEAAARRS